MLNERHLLTCFVSFTFGHWWISRGTTTGIIFNLIQFIWIHLSFSFLFFFKVHVGDRRYSGRHPVRRFLLHAGKSSLVGQQGQVSCRIAGSQDRGIDDFMYFSGWKRPGRCCSRSAGASTTSTRRWNRSWPPRRRPNERNKSVHTSSAPKRSWFFSEIC